jgi:uracil-DNA glycosylase family 4
MSIQRTLPDRTTVLASLRDYIEQLREEGLDGLPAVKPPSAASTGPQPQPLEATPMSAAGKAERTSSFADEKKLTVKRDGGAQQLSSPPATPSNMAGELFSHYPGLEKTSNLDMLREFIGDCTRCKLAPGRTNLVFGTGNPNAELMFVGEAPGADEDLRGEPFVGRAGQLLTDIIERGMGMSRNDVYICNVIKCRPPDNRNPEPDEVSACEPFLFRQIDLVRPKVIVGLGTFAVQALLKVKIPISRLRGKWHEMRGIKMMPTFHPAYLLRNPADKRLVWADIQEVMKFLGQPIPPRSTRR